MFNVNQWFLVSFIVQHTHILLNFQAPKVGATMDNTPQIIPDKYSIQHHASKFLFFTSLASQFCHFIYFTKSLLVSCELYIATRNFSYEIELFNVSFYFLRTQGFLSNQKLLSCDFSSDGNIIASGGIGASDEIGVKVNNQCDKFSTSICLRNVFNLILSFI